ncbi:MAG TPA: hypothetical protein VN372_03685 [Methanospirillum sp.]|nr:hypothetical protein [Methanospirillum sp.]
MIPDPSDLRSFPAVPAASPRPFNEELALLASPETLEPNPERALIIDFKFFWVVPAAESTPNREFSTFAKSPRTPPTYTSKSIDSLSLGIVHIISLDNIWFFGGLWVIWKSGTSMGE